MPRSLRPLDWAHGNGPTNGIKSNGTTPASGKIRPVHIASDSPKRKAVEMMDSEEEDSRNDVQAPNGIVRTSTPNGKRHRKKARMSNGMAHGRKGEDLLQQRIALPIWTGQCVRFIDPAPSQQCTR